MNSKLERVAPLQRRTMRDEFRAVIAAFAILAAATLPGSAQAYKVTNLVSDGSVPAAVVDANFINPWAISNSANWWISTAGTGFNYVIPATTGTVSFKVIVPSGANTSVNGLPSGSVATSGATGMLLQNGAVANFLFSTLDGTISGWNGRLGTNNALSQIVVNNTASGASYTGLALLNTSAGSYLLAPNFASGSIEVYDSAFKPAKLTGTFSDPNLPTGYFPFGVHVLNNQVFVTYAKRTATQPYRELIAAGAGIVDIYDNTGVLTARAVSGDNLNAPWGIALAPANFGIYSNDLLVGNFGDGIINVYDPKTFTYVGQLMDGSGKSLAYAALWELLAGGTKITNSTAVSGGDLSSVYFTAGLEDEKHGLLGAITNNPAGGAPTFGFTSSTRAINAAAGSVSAFTLSVAPVNGFSGSVSLKCSGQPIAAACTVSPAEVIVSANAVSIAAVQITTSGRAARNTAPGPFQQGGGQLILACSLPVLSLGLLRRRRGGARCLFSVITVLLLTGCVMGCGDSSLLTPMGTSQVMLQATSSTINQQTTLALTVQ